MNITLTRIEKFVSDKEISETTFCKMCGLSPSWLAHLRMKAISADAPVCANASNLKKIQSVLSGEVPIPPVGRRSRGRNHSLPTFPLDSDVTHVIKQVSESGKPITFKQFSDLCQIDWKHRHLLQELGLK